MTYYFPAIIKKTATGYHVRYVDLPTRTLLMDVETADDEEKTDLALVMPRDEQYDSFG